MTGPTALASNADLEFFLGVEEDTRRKLLRAWGLFGRRRYAWSEIWHALGIAPDQPKDLWPELYSGTERTTRLWNAARVAEEIGVAAATVNGWCTKGALPTGFPPPLLAFSAKTRGWLPLQVRAYVQPSLYAARAGRIRPGVETQAPRPPTAPAPAQTLAWHGTLHPLPPRNGSAT